MVFPQVNKNESISITSAQKRRLRRKRLHASRNTKPTSAVVERHSKKLPDLVSNNSAPRSLAVEQPILNKPDLGDKQLHITQKVVNQNQDENQNMSSKESAKSREEVIAAREAKKLAKLKAKNKDATDKPEASKPQNPAQHCQQLTKCVDEVDRVVKETVLEPTKLKEASKENLKATTEHVTDNQKSKEQILAERAAKKAAKQAKKTSAEGIAPNPEMTVKDVVETLKDIKNVAKDVQNLTDKVSAITFEAKKPDANVPKAISAKPKVEQTTKEVESKSKAELKAERRAKQEAQRAAKQAGAEKAAKDKEAAKPKPEAAKAKPDVIKEKSPKPKSAKIKSSSGNRVNWFQHLPAQHDEESLKKITLNSNLHPAIVKLSVQSATRVVSGSNARCIALLDAIKKMLKDYTLPAKTEFARGFEPLLAASLEYLGSTQQLTASQTNAVKYFRHHLTQLPNNIDEFDAKKILQQEIDHYIEDQIDKAAEAISMAVQKKICNGDSILTYSCSSLIERILVEAWSSGLRFRAVVVGDRVHSPAGDTLRRLARCGLPCLYLDITAISFVMNTVDKVLVGAESLLVNGAVVAATGSALVALVARAHNVPVLVACETHKFSERVQTDAFVYNELGDPDALIDRSDDNSPLKDWRSNCNLTPLNLSYDVTPASLVTAVVTEKAILPCTSAPVVLRTKLTEYGM